MFDYVFSNPSLPDIRDQKRESMRINRYSSHSKNTVFPYEVGYTSRGIAGIRNFISPRGALWELHFYTRYNFLARRKRVPTVQNVSVARYNGPSQLCPFFLSLKSIVLDDEVVLITKGWKI